MLVEKPIAATREEALDDDRGRRGGRAHADGRATSSASTRPSASCAAGWTAGELGRIFQISATRLGPFPARIRDVGVVVDLAPHDLDVMRYLVGSEPIRIYAETERRIHTEHEDLFNGIDEVRERGGRHARHQLADAHEAAHA